MEAYEKPSICAACGGVCCKALPGAEWPEDNNEKSIRIKLSSGNYALDWWEGDTEDGGDLRRVLFLRPSTKGMEGQVFDASWGGECGFLTSTGCSLSAEDRPRGCRELEPVEGGACINHDGAKEGAAKAWRPQQEMLERIGNEVEGKECKSK